MPSTSLCSVQLRQLATDSTPFYLMTAVVQVRACCCIVHAVCCSVQKPALEPMQQQVHVHACVCVPVLCHSLQIIFLFIYWIGIVAFARPQTCAPGTQSAPQQWVVTFVLLALFLVQATITVAATLCTFKGKGCCRRHYCRLKSLQTALTALGKGAYSRCASTSAATPAGGLCPLRCPHTIATMQLTLLRLQARRWSPPSAAGSPA